MLRITRSSKIIKKAGFDWECSHWYSLDGSQWITDRETNNLSPENKKRFMHCPSLAVAQRWLREVKGFMVETIFITDEYSVIYQANLYEVVPEKCTGIVSELISVVKGQSELKRTYEEAQEAGIKKVLEIILKKGE